MGYVNKCKKSEPVLKTTTYDFAHHLFCGDGIPFPSCKKKKKTF